MTKTQKRLSATLRFTPVDGKIRVNRLGTKTTLGFLVPGKVFEPGLGPINLRELSLIAAYAKTK